MKRKILLALAIAGAAGFWGTGCYTHRTVVHEATVTTPAPPAGEVVVTTEPPPAREEVITTAPDPNHVWVKGYWVRSHHQWVWVPGHYVVGPRAGAVWVSGHWDRTPGGWAWTPGHWG
jgi:hypothetical protein